MRLRTNLENDVANFAAAIASKANPYIHDAAYAHALLMAAEEHDPDSDYRFCSEWERVKERAAEIMKQWGYTDD